MLNSNSGLYAKCRQRSLCNIQTTASISDPNSGLYAKFKQWPLYKIQTVVLAMFDTT